MPRGRNHHYVSAFYLKGFADSNHTGEVWTPVAGTVRRKSVRQVCSEVDRYSFDLASGEFDESIEETLSQLETRVAGVIRRIRRGPTALTEADEDALATFVGSLIGGNPRQSDAMRRILGEINEHVLQLMANEPGYLERVMPEIKKEHPDLPDVSAEELRRDTNDGKFYFEPNRGQTVLIPLQVGFGLSAELRHYNWSFIYAPRGAAFITSDDPVTTAPGPNAARTPGGGFGIGNPGVYNFLPLGREVCLVLHDRGSGRGYIRERSTVRIREINKVIARNGRQQIFGHSYRLVSSLKSYVS